MGTSFATKRTIQNRLFHLASPWRLSAFIVVYCSRLRIPRLLMITQTSWHEVRCLRLNSMYASRVFFTNMFYKTSGHQDTGNLL